MHAKVREIALQVPTNCHNITRQLQC